jgi:hypothetical protein
MIVSGNDGSLVIFFVEDIVWRLDLLQGENDDDVYAQLPF